MPYASRVFLTNAIGLHVCYFLKTIEIYNTMDSVLTTVFVLFEKVDLF